MIPETLPLSCPHCRRKLRPAPLFLAATDVRRRSCICGATWQIVIKPLPSKHGNIAHIAEWVVVEVNPPTARAAIAKATGGGS